MLTQHMLVSFLAPSVVIQLQLQTMVRLPVNENTQQEHVKEVIIYPPDFMIQYTETP